MKTFLQMTSEAARPLIAEFEGCRLHAYKDIVGVWTIGYGHTGHVRSTDSITQEQADALLDHDMEARLVPMMKHVTVHLEPNEAAALLSFCVNLGLGAFYHSLLLRKLNENDKMGAADQLLRWNHAGGKVVRGLTRRREAERAVFLKG